METEICGEKVFSAAELKFHRIEIIYFKLNRSVCLLRKLVFRFLQILLKNHVSCTDVCIFHLIRVIYLPSCMIYINYTE